MEHQPGDIVWAKMRGYPYWPAKVVPKRPRERQPSATHVFVFFYGSHQVAWIPGKDICSFDKYKKRYRNVTHRLGFDEAVWEAEEDPDLSLSDAQPILLELEGRKIDKKGNKQHKSSSSKSIPKSAAKKEKVEPESNEDTKLATPTQMSPEECPTVTPVRRSSRVKPEVGTSSTKSSAKESVKRGKDRHTSPSPSPATKRRKKENVSSSQPHTHSYGTRRRNQASAESPNTFLSPPRTNFAVGGVTPSVGGATPLVGGVTPNMGKVTLLVGGVTPTLSVDIAKLPHDTLKEGKSSDVIIEGVEILKERKSSDVIIEGVEILKERKSNDDAIIEGMETKSADNVMIEGAEKSSDDVMIEGVETLESSDDVMIEEAETLKSSDKVIIEGVETLKSSDKVMIEGVETLKSSDDVMIDGLETLKSNDDVIIEGAEPLKERKSSEAKMDEDGHQVNMEDPLDIHVLETVVELKSENESHSACSTDDLQVKIIDRTIDSAAGISEGIDLIPDDLISAVLEPMETDMSACMSEVEIVPDSIIHSSSDPIIETKPNPTVVQQEPPTSMPSDAPPPSPDPTSNPIPNMPNMLSILEPSLPIPDPPSATPVQSELAVFEPVSESNVAPVNEVIAVPTAMDEGNEISSDTPLEPSMGTCPQAESESVKPEPEMEPPSSGQDNVRRSLRAKKGRSEREKSEKNKTKPKRVRMKGGKIEETKALSDTSDEKSSNFLEQNEDSGKIEDNGKETAVTGSTDVDAIGSNGKNGSIGENVDVSSDLTSESGKNEDAGSRNGSNGDENGDIGVEVTQCNGDISDNGSDKLLPVKAKVVPITDPPAPPKPPEKKKRAKSPQQIVILPSMTIVEALKAYHYNLCASLLINVTDSTLALKHLRDLIDLQFTASDVQEVKELVYTLRKIRRLKSNSRVRSRAEELYNKIKSLYIKGEVRPNPKSLTKKGPKDKLTRQRPQAVVRKINQTAKENRERDATGEDGSQRRSRRSRTKVNYTELSGGLDRGSSEDDQTVPRV